MSLKLWKNALGAILTLFAGAVLASCEKNPADLSGRPEKTNGITLADVNKAGAGAEFEVECLTVVAVNAQGVVLQEYGKTDSQNSIYAYIGEAHDLKIGDMVNISGATESRNGLLQFNKSAKITKVWHYDYVQPTPAEFTGAEIDSYMKSPSIKYVKINGTVRVAGNYVNFEVNGTANVGSFDYMTDEFKEKYDGHSLTVSGWLFGSYKTYMYMVPVEVADHGEYQEDVPEGAIFYSTFDKEIAVQDAAKYGTTKGWPWLDQFDGWKNEKGSGVANVTYSFQQMSVRTNEASKGSHSLYDGSGNNNIFFGGSDENPNYFIIENITVPSENLHLSFGAQYYSQGSANTFVKSAFRVYLSADGQTWAPSLQYDFGSVEDPEGGNWRLAGADFTLPQGTKTLYIKFVAKAYSVNRLDDVLLVAGNGGQSVEFGKPDETPLSTIESVLSQPVDDIYKISGQAVAIHTKGFLVKDNTGYILVFKKSHTVKVGDNVTVEGPTTVYGGMKQFDTTSEVTVTGNGTVSNPQAKEFKAADFESYVNAPSIKYVKYTGTLNSVKDEIYQWHNNVVVDGTEIQGTVSYPTNDLNITKYEGQKIIVTGYLLGVTGSDVKYLSTMATSLEPLEAETRPDESDALSVEALNGKLAGLSTNTALAEYKAVIGYVAANNAHGNLSGAFSLVDNTGKPNSGIIVKGDDSIPVGTKVLISLQTAKYTISNTLPTITNSTIYKLDAKAEITVPEITDAQLADYMGQYVTVKDLTSPSDATLWYDSNKKGNTDFVGKLGNTVVVYVTKNADFGALQIKKSFSGDIKGVIESYKNKLEVIPTCQEDVAVFTE